MYIHNYQIHNVLNVYRKQLSHGPAGISPKNPQTNSAADQITISTNDQRQSIIDKISTEIVERITQTGPANQFESVLSDKLSNRSQKQSENSSGHQPDFKYTVIDENNRKITNTLTIQGFSPLVGGTDSKAGENSGNNPVSDPEFTNRFEHIKKA